MRALRRIDALVVSIVLVGACSSFESTPPAGDPDAGVPDADAGEGLSDASVADDRAFGASARRRSRRSVPSTASTLPTTNRIRGSPSTSA